MVDTIQLFGVDFDVKDLSKWSLHSITERKTGETKEKETCNTSSVNATIYGDRLIFHTSLPKLLYGSNLYELKQSDAGRAIEELQRELRDGCGLDVKDGLKTFKFSRVDFCRNIVVENHISDYIQALSQLRYSRREKVGYKSETLSFRNTRRELSFYDKIKEIRSHKMSDDLYETIKDRPNNILRIESKLRKANVVKREFGEMDLSSMLSEKLSTEKLLMEYDGLTQCDSQQLDFNFQSNVELVERIREKRGRAINKLLEIKGSQRLLAECNYDWTVVKDFLTVVCDRATAYRWIKKLQANSDIMRVERDRDLIAEIRNKIRLREVA
jgi:hypothetical protein